MEMFHAMNHKNTKGKYVKIKTARAQTLMEENVDDEIPVETSIEILSICEADYSSYILINSSVQESDFPAGSEVDKSKKNEKSSAKLLSGHWSLK